MFEKRKAHRVVINTIADVDSLMKELARGGICIKADKNQIELLYIALDDFLLFLFKESVLGDLVVDDYLKMRKSDPCCDWYREIIIGFHKEYHQIVADALASDNSPNGLANGYRAINDFIAEKIGINQDVAPAVAAVETLFFNRRSDCEKCH